MVLGPSFIAAQMKVDMKVIFVDRDLNLVNFIWAGKNAAGSIKYNVLHHIG